MKLWDLSNPHGEALAESLCTLLLARLSPGILSRAVPCYLVKAPNLLTSTRDPSPLLPLHCFIKLRK